jgi:hypothetical protein
LDRRTRLFTALADWTDVEFITKEQKDVVKPDGEIKFCANESEFRAAISKVTRQTFLFIKPSPAVQNICKTSFAVSVELPQALRSQQIEIRIPSVLPTFCVGDVLAMCDAGSMWSRLRVADHAVDAIPDILRELEPGEFLFDQLQSKTWTGLLPLVCFLHRTAGDRAWSPPSLRASIMFDDPNLHWPSYGFLDYKALARHARANGYHVSIATIPLDAWFTHSHTAKYFRTHPAHLSLVVHGNNHTRGELGRQYTNRTRGTSLSKSKAYRPIRTIGADAHPESNDLSPWRML